MLKHRSRVVLTVVAMIAGVALADGSPTHTGHEATTYLDIRYRPGSRAAAAVEEIARRAHDEFDDIASQLSYTPEGRFELFLYDDVPELGAITKLEGVGGFTAGRQLHLPYDNAQTRYHEMVHLVSGQLAQDR